MNFIKYTDIENHYQSKYINYMLDRYPELRTCNYIAQEKIDGSNFQIAADGDTFRFGSRNHLLDSSGHFQGMSLEEFADEHFRFIYDLQKFAIEQKQPVRVFGELFGKGIQNRVYYGEHKYFRIFDMMIGDEYLTQKEFYNSELFYGHDLIAAGHPKLLTLEEALSLDPTINSLYTGLFYDNPNPMEGYVIKPWEIKSSFRIKLKNPSFAEKSVAREIKNKEYSDRVNGLKANFESYINDSRILSCFSKVGPIEQMSQLGHFISLILEDAKVDFFKENETNELTKEEVKYIFNSGKQIARMLQNYL
jgi:Rnl2 family RNA ligase